MQAKVLMLACTTNSRYKMRFSFIEIAHIVASVITISFALSLLGFADFTTVLLTLGLGFVLHELRHKYVAQRSGAFAEYRAWTLGLVFALATAFFLHFVFAAPGAVYIHGKHRKITVEENGKISLAGAGVNFLLAIFFIALGTANSSYADIAYLGAYVNSFLGTFNLIPYGPLDGAKVKNWSNGVWLLSFGVMLALMLSLSMGLLGGKIA